MDDVGISKRSGDEEIGRSAKTYKEQITRMRIESEQDDTKLS